MISGKTSTGFEFSVPETITNDFRFVLAYKKTRAGSADEQLIGGVELVEIVVGKENVGALMEHVAEEDGSVPSDKLMDEVAEIIKYVGEHGPKDIKN